MTPGLGGEAQALQGSCRSASARPRPSLQPTPPAPPPPFQSIFRHLDATLPKYVTRAFGCGAPAGLLYAINPALIMVLVPLVGAATTTLPHFDMIHYGSYLSALSPFWVTVKESRATVALMVATLSLGEAVWSPRWYDYSMAAAPDGREGLFTALASAPLFAAKLPTGGKTGGGVGFEGRVGSAAAPPLRLPPTSHLTLPSFVL